MEECTHNQIGGDGTPGADAFLDMAWFLIHGSDTLALSVHLNYKENNPQ